MKPKIIIFDLDGVIIDSDLPAQKNFLELYTGATKEILKEILCGNFHEEVEKYSHLKKDETEEERRIRRQKYAEVKSKVPMFNGIKELLERLYKQGYILVINTSAYSTTSPLLENLKINNLFDLVATAEFSESKVEKFKIIKDKYKVGNENMIFITDTLGDIKEASIAGVPTIAVTWGAHDRSYFERQQHSNLVGIIDSVEDLYNFITTKLVWVDARI